MGPRADRVSRFRRLLETAGGSERALREEIERGQRVGSQLVLPQQGRQQRPAGLLIQQ